MLIQFSVANHLSFKETVTFSMIAAKIKEHMDSHVFSIDKKLNLLKSSVIYGANASGKSNLFQSMNFMRRLVINSSKDTQVTDPIDVMPFLFSTATENEPSLFEIIFIHNNKKYRYGFQVDRKRVYKEWLYFVPKVKESLLFNREEDIIELGTYFKEGKDLTDKTRPNALFLSVVAQFNGTIAKEILNWFIKFGVISGIDDDSFLYFTLNYMKKHDFKKEIMKLLKKADLSIDNIESIEMKLKSNELVPSNVPVKIKERIERINKVIMNEIMMNNKDEIIVQKINTFHKKYDSNNNNISLTELDLKQESAGTQKYFALCGPIYDSLQKGNILVIDELDSRLHPLLTRAIIELFNSKETNPNNAQLIFASHDTSFLDRRLFRRIRFGLRKKINMEPPIYTH